MTKTRKTQRAAALAITALAVAALEPATGDAATYTVSQCATDSGAAAAVSRDWFTAPGMANVADACDSGGGLQLTAPNFMLSPYGSPDQFGAARFTIPDWMPNTSIKRIRSIVSVASKTGDETLSHGRVAVIGGTGAWGTSLEIPNGTWPGLNQIGLDRSSSAGARILDTIVTCYGPCHFANGPTMTLHRAELTLDDGAIPTGASVEGRGLFAGGPQAGTRQVVLSSSDGDSGVRRVELHTQDGALLASTNDAAGCTWDRPAPCPRERTQDSFTVDTTKLPEGIQGLEAWTFDAAGNRRTQQLPNVVIDNYAAPALTDPDRKPAINGDIRVGRPAAAFDGQWNGSGKTVAVVRRWQSSVDSQTWVPLTSTEAIFTPDASLEGKWLRLQVTASSSEGAATEYSEPVKVAAPLSSGTGVIVPGATTPPPTAELLSTLTANNGTGGSPASGTLVATSKADSRRVSYKRRLELTGRLVDAAGAPIAGATLDVYEQILTSGAARVKVSQVVTDAAGAYQVTPTTTASRAVEISYSRQRGSETYQSVHKVTVQVRAKVTARLVRSRIAGGGRATLRGRVLLEGIGKGALVEIQASDRGRWLTTGVARTNSSGQFSWSHAFKVRAGTIRFRAVLKASADLPALSNRSQSVTLRIGR